MYEARIEHIENLANQAEAEDEIMDSVQALINNATCNVQNEGLNNKLIQAIQNFSNNMLDFTNNIKGPDSVPDYLMNSYMPLYQDNSPRLQYSNLAQKNYYRPSNGYHYTAPKIPQARVDYINKPRTSNSYVNFDNKRSEPEVITMKPKKDSSYEQRALELERRRIEQFYNPVNEQSQIRYTAKKYPLLDNSMQTRGNSAYLNTYQEKPMPLMGDRDYVPPKFNLQKTKFEKMKQAILQEAFKNAIKTQRQADNIYGSDEEYYSQYYSLGDKPVEKAEENTNKAYGLYANKGYKNINNVLYPQDVAEIMELQKAAEEELKQIEIERWSEHLKNFTGAALEIGSAFIPAATGAKIVGTMTKALAPRFGTQLAYNLSKNAVIGAMSGSIMGLGDSMIKDENPIETMLRYAVISSALGAGLGAVEYKIGQNMVKLNKENLNNGKQENRNYKGTSQGKRETSSNRTIQDDWRGDGSRIYIRRGSIWRNTGYSDRTPRIDYEELEKSVENSEKFIKYLNQAKDSKGNYGKSVYTYTVDEYTNMRLFVSKNGKSGLAIKADGDIVSVFASDDTPIGTGHGLIELAKSVGGKKLDCFDTYLPEFYKQHGFKEIYREKWNEAYKPEGWDKEFYSKYNNGEPDVIYMELEL